MEITLILHNLRSVANVGSILRTAEGFGVKSVIFSGYTPCFDRPGMLPHQQAKINQQLAKVSLGAENWLETEFCPEIIPKLQDLKRNGVYLLGLENNIDDARLFALDQIHEKVPKQAKIALILGEEVNGISQEILPELDLLAEIPMRGHKESFNVSVAAGIAIYELTKRH